MPRAANKSKTLSASGLVKAPAPKVAIKHTINITILLSNFIFPPPIAARAREHQTDYSEAFHFLMVLMLSVAILYMVLACSLSISPASLPLFSTISFFVMYFFISLLVLQTNSVTKDCKSSSCSVDTI